MSEKWAKWGRQYAQFLNSKQHKIFLRALTELPFFSKGDKPGRFKLVRHIFFKIPLVRFSKKEEEEIKTGHYLKQIDKNNYEE